MALDSPALQAPESTDRGGEHALPSGRHRRHRWWCLRGLLLDHVLIRLSRHVPQLHPREARVQVLRALWCLEVPVQGHAHVRVPRHVPAPRPAAGLPGPPQKLVREDPRRLRVEFANLAPVVIQVPGGRPQILKVQATWLLGAGEIAEHVDLVPLKVLVGHNVLCVLHQRIK